MGEALGVTVAGKWGVRGASRPRSWAGAGPGADRQVISLASHGNEVESGP